MKDPAEIVIMGSISLRIIGCGDAFASGGQINTCFYVKGSTVQLLIDCGATSLPALKKYGVNTRQIDLIILSHFHGDHYGGLPFVLLDLEAFGQEKPLTIISPPGWRERVQALLNLLYPGSALLEKLQVHFIDFFPGQTIYTHQLLVRSFPVTHTPEALPHGIRITIEDQVISYSGDTGWTDTLIDLAADADLFICECSFYSKQVKGHLSYQVLSQNLKRLSAKRLLLTHLGDEMLKNLHLVNLDYARAGQIIEFPS